MEKTLHFNRRESRMTFIAKVVGVGHYVNQFFWDKGHPNGAEIHIITTTGIIVILNARTKKIVTALIARPQQIKRYYQNNGLQTPEFLLKIALEHERKGYNNL